MEKDAVENFLEEKKFIQFNELDWVLENSTTAKCRLPIFDVNYKSTKDTFLEIFSYSNNSQYRHVFSLIYKDRCITRIKINQRAHHTNKFNKKLKSLSFLKLKEGSNTEYTWDINKKAFTFSSLTSNGVEFANLIEKNINPEDFYSAKDYFFELCNLEGYIKEPPLSLEFL